MKQGIDPTTHKPVINPEYLIKEKKEITEKPSMLMPLSQSILTTQESEAVIMNDLNCHYNIGELALTEASRKFLMNMPALDPLCYNLNVSNYYQPSLRQFEQNFFSSMPCLNNSDQVSDNNNSVSEFSSLLVNESSSNSTSTISDYAGTWCQMSNIIENHEAGGLISCEELIRKTSSCQEQEGQLLTHNSIDFSTFPITSLSEDLSTLANFDVFHHF
ncbi:hypothetical protein TSUD_136780 [Trifolium subterraneum]|uniref:Uncharacterized protein n=1 Tax=Trifolium subterraneum TaxID=3900 RepID=A0A2Z6PMJ4_TRISU|nr:hypothetical protein TSUD_136780 [Trifolium subterraneum]